MIFRDTAAIIADSKPLLGAAKIFQTSLAGIGILCYALQIYFIFRAISDMALG